MSRINSSPSNKQCQYCDRLLIRVATRQAFTPDPMWKHASPALLCQHCDRASAMLTTAAGEVQS